MAVVSSFGCSNFTPKYYIWRRAWRILSRTFKQSASPRVPSGIVTVSQQHFRHWAV